MHYGNGNFGVKLKKQFSFSVWGNLC